MPSAQEKPIIRVAPNNPVFDLPVIVAIEEGLFCRCRATLPMCRWSFRS